MSDVRFHLLRLNELLSAYIGIQDDVFSRSIRRLIPIPGIFKRIDFAAHKANLKLIAEEVADTAQFFHKLRIDRPDVRQAIVTVQTYIKALHTAVTQLQTICCRLNAKADGGSYPAGDYNLDMAAYSKSVKEYYSFGDEMNAAFSILKLA